MPDATVTEFRDDINGVPNDVILFRRVDWDKLGGKARVPVGDTPALGGNAFTDQPELKAREYGLPGPCMSIGVGHVLERLGYSPDELLKNFDGYGLAQVRAGDLRSLTRADGTPCPQGIMLVPTEAEPWHGVVFDLNQRPRKGAALKAVARASSWTIPLIRDI